MNNRKAEEVVNRRQGGVRVKRKFNELIYGLALEDADIEVLDEMR